MTAMSAPKGGNMCQPTIKIMLKVQQAWELRKKKNIKNTEDFIVIDTVNDILIAIKMFSNNKFYCTDFFNSPYTNNIKEILENLGYKVNYALDDKDAIISW